MHVTPDALVGVHQFHSAEVVHMTEPTLDRPKADAMVTNTPGLALSILTADCQPVLFGDAENGVIGAAHAGWGGALGGVLEATIEAMEVFAQGKGDRVQFDLPGYGLKRLRDAGVRAEWTRHCTYSDPGRFFSYRRSVHGKEADYGRLIATIRL